MLKALGLVSWLQSRKVHFALYWGWNIWHSPYSQWRCLISFRRLRPSTWVESANYAFTKYAIQTFALGFVIVTVFLSFPATFATKLHPDSQTNVSYDKWRHGRGAPLRLGVRAYSGIMDMETLQFQACVVSVDSPSSHWQHPA